MWHLRRTTLAEAGKAGSSGTHEKPLSTKGGLSSKVVDKRTRNRLPCALHTPQTPRRGPLWLHSGVRLVRWQVNLEILRFNHPKRAVRGCYIQ